jgi:hypothetical protein
MAQPHTLSSLEGIRNRFTIHHQPTLTPHHHPKRIAKFAKPFESHTKNLAQSNLTDITMSGAKEISTKAAPVVLAKVDPDEGPYLRSLVGEGDTPTGGREREVGEDQAD